MWLHFRRQERSEGTKDRRRAKSSSVRDRAMRNISNSSYLELEEDYMTKKLSDNLFHKIKNRIEESGGNYMVTDEHEYTWDFSGLTLNPPKPVERKLADEIYKIWVKIHPDSNRTISWKVSVTTNEISFPLH